MTTSDIITALESDSPKEDKIELLASLAEDEVPFTSLDLCNTLKTLALSNERDLVFFSAYALGVGNKREASNFVRDLEVKKYSILIGVAKMAIDLSNRSLSL